MVAKAQAKGAETSASREQPSPLKRLARTLQRHRKQGFFTTCFHFAASFNPESSVAPPHHPSRHLLESARTDVLPRPPSIHVPPGISKGFNGWTQETNPKDPEEVQVVISVDIGANG